MRTTSAFQPNTETLLTSLISYYKLDESSGNAVDSIGSYTLTNNGTTPFAACKINNGATFGTSNSTKYFSATHIDPDSYNTGLSISFWFNMGTITANMEPFSWGDTSNSGVHMRINSSTSINVRFGNGIGADGGSFTGTVSTMSTGTWYHFAMTHSATENKFYLNGSLIATDSTNVTLSGSTTTFNMGRNTAAVNYWQGSLDELGIWGKELSADEVSRLYANGNGRTINIIPNTTKAYYPLNGNSRDYSGNTNTGTDTSITYPQGRFGQGARFNGTSSVITMADHSSLDVTGSLTVSCWVKISAQIGTNMNWAFAGKTAGGSNRSWWFDYQDVAGVKTLRLNISANGTAVTTKEVSYTMPVGQWINLQAVYDTSATTTYLYVNGRLQGTPQTGSAASIFNSTASLELGAIHAATIYFYSGLQDEVIIESRAWTAKEVELYYRKSTLNYKQKSYGSSFASYLIAIAQGTYTLTGVDTLFNRGIRMLADLGTYALTGIDVLFNIGRGYALAIETGIYNLTGINVRLVSSVKWRTPSTKSTSTWTDETKNTSTWTGDTKNTSTWTEDTKNSSTWTNLPK